MTTSTFSFRRPVGHVGHLAALGAGVISLFLGLFFSAQAGLLVLAGAWIAFLTWRYPWLAFLALIAVAPFLLILKATVVLGAITVLKDVVILTLFFRCLRREMLTRIPAPVFVALIALAGWAFLAFIRADAQTIGLLRLRDLLLYMAVFPVALQLVNTRERLRTFIQTFLWIGVLVLALGAIQWVAFPDGMVLRFDAVRQIWIPRLSSVLAHPNHLGGFLLLLVPLSLALALTRGTTWIRGSAVVLTVAGLITTYATYSRSAWISVTLAVATVVFFWSLGKYLGRVLISMGLVGVLMLGSLLLPPVQNRVRAYIDPAYQSNRTRLEIVAGTLTGVSNTGAVIGEGLGDVATLLGRTADLALYDLIAADARGAQRAKARTFVDNAVVKTWVEQGTVGLVLAAWVGIRVFLAARKRHQQSEEGETQAFALACVGILVGLAAMWWLLDVPDMFPLNMYFWTFAGSLVGSGQWAANSTESEALRTVR